MSLIKRGKSKVWQMSFSINGKQYRRSTGTTDKQLAQKIHAKVITQIMEGKWFDKSPGEYKTFRELVDRYLCEHSAVNKAPSSHLRDKGLAKHLNKFFGDQALTEISPRHIAEYKSLRRSEGAAPRTIQYELSFMSHAFNLAIREWEWVSDNPVSKVSKIKVDNAIERWLTQDEEVKLLAESSQWLQEIILLAINTGLRQGEILSLRWSQIDFRRKTVMILEQKNGSKDTLPLNENTLEVLNARTKVQYIKADYVFYSGAGTKIDVGNLMRAFRGAVARAGIAKLRFHDLRHTFATRLAQAGVDIYTIQKLGRWKTTSMVMRYAHHYSESLRPGVEVLDRLREESRGRISTNLAHSGETQ